MQKKPEAVVIGFEFLGTVSSEELIRSITTNEPAALVQQVFPGETGTRRSRRWLVTVPHDKADALLNLLKLMEYVAHPYIAPTRRAT